MQEKWIDGHGADGWTVTGLMLVGMDACCILMGWVLLWRKTVRIVDIVDDETRTLEEGTRDPEIPKGVMITKNGRAAHRRNDCPFLLILYSIWTLSLCSHCDPSDASESALGGGALGNRTSFEPHSVSHHFPVTDLLVPRSTIVHQFVQGSDMRQRFLLLLVKSR